MKNEQTQDRPPHNLSEKLNDASIKREIKSIFSIRKFWCFIQQKLAERERQTDIAKVQNGFATTMTINPETNAATTSTKVINKSFLATENWNKAVY